MILVSGTFTILARLAGAVATRTLGWAAILLFGRVPQERLRLLSLIALAAVAWMICVIALLVPAVNRLVTAAVPRPSFIHPSLLGLVLLAGAFGLPAIVGVALAVLTPGISSRPAERLARVARGYVFTPVLAGVIIFLAAWSIARAVSAARPGWSSEQIPMIVKPGGYEAVVDDVARALRDAGIGTRRHPAAPWFEVPPRLLAAAGGLPRRDDLPDRLTGLSGDGIHVLVYPSAVTMTGLSATVIAARIAVVRCLAFSDAYLTTAKEAEEAEDRLRELAGRPFVQAVDFEPIDAILRTQPLPADDWETLLRLRFQVEHDVLVERRRVVGEA